MKVAKLVHRLVALGEGLQEHWIVAIILSSLPTSYDALITALESRPVADFNIYLTVNINRLQKP